LFYIDVELGVTLRAGHRPSVFEVRMLRRICGPMREELICDCKPFHSGELHYLLLAR
jgi:hypothetical protein